MADQKLTALTEISLPDLEDLLYTVDDPSGTPVNNKVTARRLFGLLGQIVEGRLTTESGVPVSTSDRTAQSTIYFTPYNGNRIRLYDGTRWRLYVFSEISLALTALVSSGIYDVFVYDNAGALTLELSAVWLSNTTRQDALTTQDGVVVKSGATTRLHVGTIRTTGAATTEDSGGGVTTQTGGKRFVWNRYNQVRRSLAVFDSTDSWSYATATVRQANAATGNKVEYVTGDAGTSAGAIVLAIGYFNGASVGGRVGVGVDSVTAFSGVVQSGFSLGGGVVGPVAGRYTGQPGLGYHYFAWLEMGNGNTVMSWIGDNGTSAGTGEQSGLQAEVMM
jgi:hypothetical protein